MKILLLSAYDAPSHKRWRENLAAALPEYEWTMCSLPARYFNWRIRGNSLTFAYDYADTLNQTYDLLIVTSMVDLSALRGFVPALCAIPTIVYFHENQFAYPTSQTQQSLVEPQILTLYTALCGDAVVFNSEFNRTSFFTGAKALLKKLPDCVPKGLLENLQKKTQVLPVPLEDALFKERSSSLKNAQSRLQIVWNHRWEYDKNPELLLKTLEKLELVFNGNLPFDLHVVGQQFRERPKEFEKIKALLTRTKSLGCWGFLFSVSEYRELLSGCHIVLSTASHDFQGLAVLEAVAAGCLPLLPLRQAYPEWFARRWCYEVGDLACDTENLTQALLDYLKAFSNKTLPAAPDVSSFSLSRLTPAYRSLLGKVREYTL